MLTRACADALTWPEGVGVAVNVSAASLGDAALADMVAEVLRSTGLAAGRLELKVTENALISRERGRACRAAPDPRRWRAHRHRRLRRRLLLPRLPPRFPFDKIKINQSFVSRLGERKDRHEVARAIVASISRLYADLGIVCSAEGVETAEQLSGAGRRRAS